MGKDGKVAAGQLIQALPVILERFSIHSDNWQPFSEGKLIFIQTLCPPLDPVRM